LARTAIGTGLATAIFLAPAAVASADPPPPPGPYSSVIPRDALVPGLTASPENGEMNMTQLQSVVSERQLAVQLTQRLMEQMDQTTRDMMKNCPSCFGP
jgi:hypothetical protein